MSVYDDNVEVSSDSFWEIGQYKKTVKRVDDGFELCTRLMQLIQERADIEKGYSANLKKCTIRNRLVDNVQAELKSWQKENYHKSALPPQRLKNSKDLEDKFQKAQKPWAKQYKHVQDCKKAYHSACKTESGLQQQQQAAGDSAQPEAIKKLSDKLRKAEREVTKSRTAYESAVADLDGQRSAYTAGMSDVFAEAQEFERTRLEFFKAVLGHLHEALNISNEERIPQTYENLLHTVQRADADQDLRWWAQNHGDCMPVQWPQFEEFGASPPTGGGGDGGSVRGKKSGGSSLTAEEPTGRAGGGGNFRNSGHQQSHDVDSPTADNYSSNPFDDEMPPQSGDASGALEDDGRQGVPVRALYDYTGTEEDELSFQAGDVFEKLDDEDEQGWCKGRKDGRAGLYPANYVELA
uniref:SH3 domain-containing protein n=2 Tax=Macrostomum lignano TaxID=282301 RepID=A0A1I8GUJ9_9PLAT